jgi:hypothetical protein
VLFVTESEIEVAELDGKLNTASSQEKRVENTSQK